MWCMWDKKVVGNIKRWAEKCVYDASEILFGISLLSKQTLKFAFVTYHHVICNKTLSGVRYTILPFLSTPLIFFCILFVLLSCLFFVSLWIFRYGPIFRTNILGQSVVISTDAEVNYRVFQQENNCFELCYSESFTRITGKQGLAGYHGDFHKYLRSLMLKLVSPEALREKMINDMVDNTREHLSSWSKLGKLDAKDGTDEVN